jgi:RNA polymerase sigma-70 factor, ECF subfamily
MPAPSQTAPPVSSSLPPRVGDDEAEWLDRFHRGDRQTIEACYRSHFATVERATRDILGSADRETVIHEVFSRLIATPELRRSFRGGAFGAWLATVARNLAIDYRRRLGREVSGAAGAEAASADRGAAGSWEESAQARLLVERFRRDHLPPEWQGVFELRFLHELPQREAASRLGINRTTLAYREVRTRWLLRRYLLDGIETTKKAP